MEGIQEFNNLDELLAILKNNKLTFKEGLPEKLRNERRFILLEMILRDTVANDRYNFEFIEDIVPPCVVVHYSKDDIAICELIPLDNQN